MENCIQDGVHVHSKSINPARRASHLMGTYLKIFLILFGEQRSEVNWIEYHNLCTIWRRHTFTVGHPPDNKIYTQIYIYRHRIEGHCKYILGMCSSVRNALFAFVCIVVEKAEQQTQAAHATSCMQCHNQNKLCHNWKSLAPVALSRSFNYDELLKSGPDDKSFFPLIYWKSWAISLLVLNTWKISRIIEKSFVQQQQIHFRKESLIFLANIFWSCGESPAKPKILTYFMVNFVLIFYYNY